MDKYIVREYETLCSYYEIEANSHEEALVLVIDKNQEEEIENEFVDVIDDDTYFVSKADGSDEFEIDLGQARDKVKSMEINS